MAIEAEDGDRIRIAVALCALKFKPRDQSFEAYVLDLQTAFARPLRHGLPALRTESDTSSWRQRALALEKDLAELQAKYDGEHIKVLELSSGAPALEASSSTSKKKGKKKTISNTPSEKEHSEKTVPITPVRLDLVAVLEGLAPGIPATPGPLSLFATFTEFQRLTSTICNTQSNNRTLLLSVALRALNASAAALQPFVDLRVAHPLRGSATRVTGEPELLQTLGVLIVHLVDTAIPLLGAPLNGFPSDSNTAIGIAESSGSEHIISKLVNTILLPILHGFAPLSLSFSQQCFAAPSRKRESQAPRNQRHARPPSAHQRPDVRQALLTLFRDVLQALCAHTTPTCGIKELLSLAAAQELRKLFPGDRLTNTATRQFMSSPASENSAAATDSGSGATSFAGKGKLNFAIPVYEHENITLGCLATSPVTASASNKCNGKNNSRATGRGGRGEAVDVWVVSRPGLRTGASQRGERASRIAALGRKDAIWFLCAVLHITFDAPEAWSGHPSVSATISASCTPPSQPQESSGSQPSSVSGSRLGSGPAAVPAVPKDKEEASPVAEALAHIRAQIVHTLIELLRPASGTWIHGDISRPTQRSSPSSPWPRPTGTYASAERHGATVVCSPTHVGTKLTVLGEPTGAGQAADASHAIDAGAAGGGKGRRQVGSADATAHNGLCMTHGSRSLTTSEGIQGDDGAERPQGHGELAGKLGSLMESRELPESERGNNIPTPGENQRMRGNSNRGEYGADGRSGFTAAGGVWDDGSFRGTRCGSGEVDAVARGMVLAALERYWLWSAGR